MATTNIKVRTGNRTVVKIKDQEVGLIQSIRASDDYGLEPVGGIGDIHSIEMVPTVARHSISVQQLVLYTGALRQLGISLENGDGALKGEVFDIITMDKNGDTLRKYTNCSFASGDLEISAHRVMSSSCQFNALDVSGTGA